LWTLRQSPHQQLRKLIQLAIPPPYEPKEICLKAPNYAHQMFPVVDQIVVAALISREQPAKDSSPILRVDSRADRTTTNLFLLSSCTSWGIAPVSYWQLYSCIWICHRKRR
jgi:hypothetical protein